MPNVWKSKININNQEQELKESLCALFGKNISNLSHEFQAFGFSGGTFRVNISFEDKEEKAYIVKKVGNPEAEVAFYKEVLTDLSIVHAQCFGSIKVGEDYFIVMDYVPHTEVDYKDVKRYEDAVDWLIDKDSKVISQPKILEHFSISNDFHNVFNESFLFGLKEAVANNVNESIDQNFLNIVLEKKEKLSGLNNKLSTTPQTINHNDFQMNNILFRIDGDSPVVIDWTHPNQGSVLVDLVALICTAPREVRDDLVNRYRKSINFEDFETAYKVAIVRNRIGVFGWMLKVLNEGQGDKLYMPDFLDIRQMVIDF